VDVKLTNVHLDASAFPTTLHYVDAGNNLQSVAAGDLGNKGKVALWLSNGTGSSSAHVFELQPGGTVSSDISTSNLTYYNWVATSGGYIAQSASPIYTLANGTGTATSAPINLAFGSNTITVTGLGNFIVTLPTGMTGTATTGTTTVGSSPFPLVAGANTVTTSGSTGTFTINLNSGILANSGGTATGAPVNLTYGATTNTITTLTSGTFTVTLPIGMTGTATSGTTAVTGSPQALAAGANTVTTSGAVGNFTITTTTAATTWLAVPIPDGTGASTATLAASGAVYLHVSEYLAHVADSTTNNSVQAEKLYSDFVFTLRQQ
jgi:hypothetical protein